MLTRMVLVSGNGFRNIFGMNRRNISTILATNSVVKRNMSTGIRKERDTFGELQVPADRYYGAQTARFNNFF